MIVKLVNAEGTELVLPDGFGMEELAPSALRLSMHNIVGRDGGVVDALNSSLEPKEIILRGKLQDCELIEARSFQAARAAVLEDYFEILGFLNNARNLGPVKIYRESGVVVDPAGEGYDADLAPLGYHLLGYYRGGSAPTYWGGFGNAILDLTLNFTCPRPFWQGYFNTSSTAGNVGGGNILTATFTVLGTVPARPQIIIHTATELTFASDKPLVMSSLAKTISWAGVIDANAYLVFDFASGQVFTATELPTSGYVSWDGTAATNKSAGITDTDDWASLVWEHPHGANGVVLSSDLATAAAVTVHVRFSNEYYG